MFKKFSKKEALDKIALEVATPIVCLVNYKLELFNRLTKTSVTIEGKLVIPSKEHFRICVESLQDNNFTWGAGDNDSSSTNFTSLDYDKEVFSKISSVFWYTEEEAYTHE
jgi:hypothetical protein